MISKIKTSSSFASSINYALREESKPVIKMINGLSLDKRSMIQDFKMQASLRPSVKTNVVQFILSHSPKDTETIKGKENTILRTWIDELKKKDINLDNTQYVIVKHNNTKHPHYHMYFNKIDNQGNRIDINGIAKRAKSVSMKITREYGLTKAYSKKLMNLIQHHPEQALHLLRKDKPFYKELSKKIMEKNIIDNAIKPQISRGFRM